MDAAGNANFAGIGKSLNAGGDVYAFAVDILAVVNDVAKIDPHAKIQRVRGQIGLHGVGAIDGILNRRKFDEKTVTGQLNNLAGKVFNVGLNNFFARVLPGGNGDIGILFHKSRISRYISSKNTGKSALNLPTGHGLPYSDRIPGHLREY